MASRLANFFNSILPGVNRERTKPFQEQGTTGFSIYGGYLQSIERSKKLQYSERERTVADMLANISIIAASTRYFVNLVSKSNWTVKPALDIDGEQSSEDAKRVAELVERAMYGMDVSWTRFIRRSSLYRFHGFAIQEWTAKRNLDGTITYKTIDSRPQHTITRWDLDKNANVVGVVQTSVQTGQDFYLPRKKIIYFVDDTLTDYPDGMGVFRHLVEPSERLKEYLRLEGTGFTRDLRGIPIGRAPYLELQRAVTNGEITAEYAQEILKEMENFVKLQTKDVDTSITLDSSPYLNVNENGQSFSSAMKFGLELLSGAAPGLTDINTAINRTNQEMARIIGTENLMLGNNTGSYGLSEDKSKNLFLQVEATLSDISETCEIDFIEPLFRLNGIPEELKPTLAPEGLQFREFQEVSRALADMARAGAVLTPDDPVIDDVRGLMGVSLQPELNQLANGELTDEQLMLGGN